MFSSEEEGEEEAVVPSTVFLLTHNAMLLPKISFFPPFCFFFHRKVKSTLARGEGK
jgi:hypothetical protein